jgi:hypothetical protein
LVGVSFEYLGAGIGVAVVEPKASNPAQALSDADAAMYVDKKARKVQGLSGIRKLDR